MNDISVVTVIGARPQFVKAAVVSRALEKIGVNEAIVHTGQHYDEEMSGQFLAQLEIRVSKNLGVGSGTQSEQTGRMMMAFEHYLSEQSQAPNAIIVYGDTNSTIAASIVASKNGIKLVHVEAGLRSFNRDMPEEINRVVTDHLSDLLFCSSEIGVNNLKKEGIISNIHNVGDVMLDSFLSFSGKKTKPTLSPDLMRHAEDNFALMTLHRPVNTTDQKYLVRILQQIGGLHIPVIWPVHPRNVNILRNIDIPNNIKCISPVGYFEMLQLLLSCNLVLTDSGGLQKEAHWAQRRCLTLRSETEWSETLSGGWNVLVDPERDNLAALADGIPTEPWKMLYGDGHASARIASTLLDFLKNSD